jgi:hypothetical protein
VIRWSWKLGLGTGAIVFATWCAGQQDVAFETLCADEHVRRAAKENRLADEHFARVRRDLARGLGPEPGEGNTGPLTWPEHGGVYDLDQPEHYTLDPRVRSPSDRDVEEARRHRRLAERHEAAAARLEGGCPRPSARPG